MKKKETAPSMAQWEELYEVSMVIKSLAPWEKLWDVDLFTIMLPDQKEPVFVSVMGRGGDCYGIGVYPGYEAISGFYRIMESPENSSMSAIYYQNSLMCYFGSRDELATKERELIKSLGLHFRGRTAWIYFRAMTEGCYPWFFNAEQADLMIQALGNFVMAYRHFDEGEISVDFENGETLVREYDSERGKWRNGVCPMPPIPEIKGELVFTDELLLQKLKKRPKVRTSLELDIAYFPQPVQDKPDEVPYFPRILILLDHQDGRPVAQHILDREVKDGEAATRLLVSFTEEMGKPEQLFVRDKYFLPNVESFCTQIGIPLVYGESLPFLDEFAEGLLDFLNEQ